MEQLLPVLYSQFALGLYLGLLIALFVWKSNLSRNRAAREERLRLQNELKELQGHLHTQLKINASGSDTLQRQVDDLRLQNENLRVNLASLQQKPGRAELRQLHVLDQAVSRMREQAPGFAAAWERALREAEGDVSGAESGLKKLMRRVMPGIGNSPNNDPRDRQDRSRAEDI
jgi:hypothetical protein